MTRGMARFPPFQEGSGFPVYKKEKGRNVDGEGEKRGPTPIRLTTVFQFQPQDGHVLPIVPTARGSSANDPHHMLRLWSSVDTSGNQRTIADLCRVP